MALSTTWTHEYYDPVAIDWVGLLATNYAPGVTIQPSVAGNTLDQRLYVPVQPPSGSWPVDTEILARAAPQGEAVDFLAQMTDVTVTSAMATENPDGTGPSYALAAGVSTGNEGLVGGYITFGSQASPDQGILIIAFTNPTDRTLYLQSISGTIRRTVAIPHYHNTTAPPSVIGPTTPPPSTTLPPEVVQRKLLEKANPGLTCDLLRWQQTDDLVSVFLGQKVVLTVEGVRGRLGMHSRGYVITRMRVHWRAEVAGTPRETLETIITLEKIKGVLLGGAGTSDSEQDDASTGGDLSLFARWDVTGAGWGSGWAA